MPHEFIEIGPNHLRLKDSDIWMLRHFLMRAIDMDLSGVPQGKDHLIALYDLLNRWNWQGPGVIVGCDFNNYTTSPQRHDVLRQTLLAAGDLLVQFGDNIPLDYLQEHLNTSSLTYLAAQPTSKTLQIISSCLELLGKKP